MENSDATNPVRLYVWDLPLRLFHWMLAAATAAAVVTGQLGGAFIDWHARAGLLVLGLIVFRLVWGFAGSTYARFRQFLPRPSAVWAHITGHWRGIGHNPLGALSVLALLALVAAQTVTGLFANDDISFQGPLFDVVSKDLSDAFTAVHQFTFNLVVALVGLHVAAIVYYARARGDNLVVPMITGYKTVPAALGGTPRSAGVAPMLLALALAAAVTWSIGSGWLGEQLAPAPAVTAPAPAW